MTLDFPHKDVLSISEQLRNIRAESKRNKDTSTEKPLSTPSYVTPVTQKDNLLSDDTPPKYPQGTNSRRLHIKWRRWKFTFPKAVNES